MERETERIALSLDRIAAALERQADNDPLAVLNAALEGAPEQIALKPDVHSMGGSKWVGTVNLAAVAPGWSLDLAPWPAAVGGVLVTLVGPGGIRRPLTAADDA